MSQTENTQASREKLPFTVLVLRPDYIADTVGHDTFLAHVEAHSVEMAQSMAQLQASNADCTDDAERADANPEDYYIIAVFEGHLDDLKTK